MNLTVEKGWLTLTAIENKSTAFVCAVSVTGIIPKSGGTVVCYGGDSVMVTESATDIREALDTWYARPKDLPRPV